MSWEKRPPTGEDNFRVEASEDDGASPVYVSPDVAVCRGVPRRAVQPGGPAVRLPVSQLHELRAAAHDHRRCSVRSPADDNGLVHDVRRLPQGIRESRGSAIPRPTDRLPGLRSATSAIRCIGPANCHSRPDHPLCRGRPGGKIGALKGLGGYHLVCAAGHGRAVEELRRRKHRDEKPFAVMVADAAAAAELAEVSPEEPPLLVSRGLRSFCCESASPAGLPRRSHRATRAWA